jgi:hypothetical protein
VRGNSSPPLSIAASAREGRKREREMEEGEDTEGEGPRSGFLSEVHVGCPHLPKGDGNGATSTTVFSRYAFFPPPSLQSHEGIIKSEEEEEEEQDEDELVVRRKRRRTDRQQCITIRHSMDTTLLAVGLQVPKIILLGALPFPISSPHVL